jgi:hypothetical protein
MNHTDLQRLGLVYIIYIMRRYTLKLGGSKSGFGESGFLGEMGGTHEMAGGGGGMLHTTMTFSNSY